MTPPRRALLVALLLAVSLPARLQAALYYQAEGEMAPDFDHDGTVGFADFVGFARHYDTSSGGASFDPLYDLNKDGTVNFNDFVAFAASFGLSTGQAAPTSVYTLYVRDPGTSSIDVYDMETHLYQEFLPFRNPQSVIVSQDQARIYVNEGFGTFVLNAAHEVLFSVPSNAPGRMAVAPGERVAYVGEQANDLVRVIDLVGRRTTDTIAVGDGPGSLVVSPDGKKVCVLNLLTVSVLDAVAGSEVARLDAGGAPGEVSLSSDGRKAFFTFQDRASVGVVDLSRNELVGEIQLEGDNATGIALSPDGSRLYVGTTTSLVEVDPKRNLVLRSLPVGDQTSVVAVTPDGRFAYVGALESSVFVPGVVVVDLPGWKVVGRIRGFTFPAEIAFRRNPR